MKTIFGSHLYGLNTPESDMDYKGIFIPDPKSILLQKAISSETSSTGNMHSKNSKDDIDLEMFSLHKFISLAMKGETVALDMLHAPSNMIVETSDIWKELQENRWRFYTTNLRSYMGYVRTQASKYGIKGTRVAAIESAINNAKLAVASLGPTPIDRPFKVADIINLLETDNYRIRSSDEKNGITYEYYQVLDKKFQVTLKVDEYISILEQIYNKYGQRAMEAKENKGIDWKAISHAIRGGLQLIEIYSTGDLKYPLAQRDLVLKVKLGQLDFTTEVQPLLEEICDKVERLALNLEESGVLSCEPDYEFWDKFLIKHYGTAVTDMLITEYFDK